MIFDALEHLVNSFSHAEPVDQVDQIQVRQLPVQAVDLDVDVADLLGRDFQVDSSLDGSRSGLEISVIQKTVVGNLGGGKDATNASQSPNSKRTKREFQTVRIVEVAGQCCQKVVGTISATVSLFHKNSYCV